MTRKLLDDVRAWVEDDPDPEDRATLEELVRTGNEEELRRRFENPLTFGTAGLRGPVMAGPAGMNRLSVRRATQGVVAWLREGGAEGSGAIVVGRDARRGSEAFNDEVVAVLLGAGWPVLEMPGPLPTPLVAYAVQALHAAAGIMITASHNPPLDNGYKLYGPGGAQIVAPDDETVQRYARRATSPALGARSNPLHRFVPPALWAQYRDHMVKRFEVPGGSDLRISYTPLHGVGGASMMELFERSGYRRVFAVAEQFVPDGAFPTLAFPNPEEPGALDLALANARVNGSTLVLANDPDADRLGAAVAASDGWRILRGDEIGWLLASHLLDSMTAPDDVVATTIVSSTMLAKMAASRGVRCVTTLTGFKWLSRAADGATLRFSYEEALGFAVDPVVADKDGMSAALALCQLAHGLARRGQTLLDRLDDLERQYGIHSGDQLALRADGPEGRAAIARVMEQLRVTPPHELGGVRVSEVIDLARGWRGLAPSEGVVLVLGDEGRVVVRPSGTEAKLKAYFEVTRPPEADSNLLEGRASARRQLQVIRDDLAELVRL